MINRRGFVGTVLAGLGGLLFSQKLFAHANSFLSNEEILYRVLEKSQDYVIVTVRSPMYCRTFKKKVYCLVLDNLYCLMNDSEFGFSDKHLHAVIPIDNIHSIHVVFRDNTRILCYLNNGRWKVF